MSNAQFETVFGSLDRYVKGDIEIINDDPKNYMFSNVYDVAARSAPYEKVVVGKNRRYVIEALRAESTSAWFAAAHDEFALVMDGTINIDLVKLAAPRRIVSAAAEGSVKLSKPPEGKAMGRITLRRGHQALLPAGAAYRFRADNGAGVILLQTMLGPHSVEKWAEICYT